MTSGRVSPVTSRGEIGTDRTGADVTVHHVLRRPSRVRNVSPLTVLVPADPVTVTEATRPPHVPVPPPPEREPTATVRRVPTVGKAFWTEAAGSENVHRPGLAEDATAPS